MIENNSHPTPEDIVGKDMPLLVLHFTVTHKKASEEDHRRAIKDTGFSKEEIILVKDYYDKLRKHNHIPLETSPDGEKILWGHTCPIKYNG